MKKKIISRNNTGQLLDTIFCVHGEMVSGNGEDSYAFSTDGKRTLLSVFDGCGGIGARRFENFSGKTGAFVASRAVSGAVSTWFAKGEPCERLHEYIRKSLSVCERYADKSSSRIRGSLGKRFPTTAAITIFSPDKHGIDAQCFWAGDSRCYCLDVNGLHQLSRDDVSGTDAMSNLRDDGILTNVVNSSEPFEIRHSSYRFNQPCVLFTATDGCFGYIQTPMEFEYALLYTLACSKSLSEWNTSLNKVFTDYSSDDYTLCLSAIGFGSYDDLVSYFAPRLKELNNMYIDPMMKKASSEEELWAIYSAGYYGYMNRNSN